ncbi:MAG: 50S ribosomal protein L4 [bacterium]|nr:50S ribosomal protein L4 [bacterium]
MKKAINTKLVAQAVSVVLSNKRQGTSKTKTRAEVSRTKKKLYKQKGTGGARHGARSAPIFVGGGVAHGPRGNANWSRALPPAMKRQALSEALSMQAAVTSIISGLSTLTGKTKGAVELLKKAAPDATKICIVLDKSDANVLRSLRNIARVTPVLAAQLNVLHVVQADAILFTKESKAMVDARIGGEPSVVVVEKPVVESAAKKPAAKKTVTKKAVAKKTTVKPAVTKAKKA